MKLQGSVTGSIIVECLLATQQSLAWSGECWLLFCMALVSQLLNLDPHLGGELSLAYKLAQRSIRVSQLPFWLSLFFSESQGSPPCSQSKILTSKMGSLLSLAYKLEQLSICISQLSPGRLYSGLGSKEDPSRTSLLTTQPLFTSTSCRTVLNEH